MFIIVFSKSYEKFWISFFNEDLCLELTKFDVLNQLLVGLVVIDAEFSWEDHGSIPYNCDRKGAETT
jgi:hypothetical protein